MAFPICLDFIDDEIREAIIETNTNLLFVPAMSSTGLSHFEETAKSLGRSHHCISLIVNSCWCVNPPISMQVGIDKLIEKYEDWNGPKTDEKL